MLLCKHCNKGSEISPTEFQELVDIYLRCKIEPKRNSNDSNYYFTFSKETIMVPNISPDCLYLLTYSKEAAIFSLIALKNIGYYRFGNTFSSGNSVSISQEVGYIVETLPKCYNRMDILLIRGTDYLDERNNYTLRRS